MERPRAQILTWRGGVAVLAIGAFMTFINPFGATASLPAWAGLLYWTLLVGEGWFGATLIGFGLGRVFPSWHSELNRAISTVLIAFVISATIIGVQYALGDHVPLWYWPRLYGLVLGISAAVAAVAWLMERAFAGGPGAVTHAPQAGATAAPVRFMERLPAKLKGAAIYAISAEDHYLRLHTSKGSDLILLRLSDAIAELEGLEGAQTHRSWWVARDAVESARRDGDKMVLTLKGGGEAPVSRPNVKPLREAGWF
ncbi:MAG: LytTR family transcriptional regulator DNA-binding domain-containing protein [Hyphomonadaceae bacterium]|nr:LytTR family transcriptional regulator DNA-binding domain-containing protein [Hyphomonadaceae bacterium]